MYKRKFGKSAWKFRLERLDENIGALAVELKPDDLREIKSAISKITVQGDRYPENLKQMTGL